MEKLIEGQRETAVKFGEAEPASHTAGVGYLNNIAVGWESQLVEDNTFAILNLGNGSNEDLCMHTVVGLGCSSGELQESDDQLTLDSNFYIK